MVRANLRRWVSITSLLLAVGLGVGTGQAEAGLGIIVTDPILIPILDPLTRYDFKLSLVAGNQILQGDNITFLNVPDFSGTARYVFTSGGIDYSQFFSIVPTPGSSAGFTNIELVLTASPASLTNTSQTTNLPIGDLLVDTTETFPPASNSPLFTPLNYTTQTHLFPLGTLNTGAGITPLPSVVPEPASVALLGVGIASVLVLTRGRRPALTD